MPSPQDNHGLEQSAGAQASSCGDAHHTQPSATHNRDSQANAVHSVKTCTIWRDHPNTWFNQLDAKFRANNVRSDDLKFCLVIDNLDKETMLEVADVLDNPPEDNKYQKLKDTLISRLTDSDEKKWKKLLTDLELGDRKPTSLLREMRTLTGNAVSEQMLQTLWLQRMPVRVQELLAVVENVPLDKLAELADKAIERTVPSVNEVATQRTTEPTIAAINELTKQLQQLISSYNYGRPRSRTPSSRYKNYRNTPRDTDRQPKICYYHTKFGINARKCTKTCTFQRTQQPDNTPGN